MVPPPLGNKRPPTMPEMMPPGSVKRLEDMEVPDFGGGPEEEEADEDFEKVEAQEDLDAAMDEEAEEEDEVAKEEEEEEEEKEEEETCQTCEEQFLEMDGPGSGHQQCEDCNDHVCDNCASRCEHCGDNVYCAGCANENLVGELCESCRHANRR